MTMEIVPSKITQPSKSKNLPSLALCIGLDLIGMASFSIPFIGEFSDIIWAPLSAVIYFSLFGGKIGLIGGAFSFLEELLPFTDILPTFTLSWLIRKRKLEKEFKPLQTVIIKAK